MKRVYEFVAYTADRIIRSEKVLAASEESARDIALAELLANDDVQSPRGPFDNDLPPIADVTIEIRPWARPTPVDSITRFVREKPVDWFGYPKRPYFGPAEEPVNPLAPTIYCKGGAR